MDVCGRVGVLQASMRACRFEPLPEMRTSSLLGRGELGREDIVALLSHSEVVGSVGKQIGLRNAQNGILSAY